MGCLCSKPSPEPSPQTTRTTASFAGSVTHPCQDARSSTQGSHADPVGTTAHPSRTANSDTTPNPGQTSICSDTTVYPGRTSNYSDTTAYPGTIDSWLKTTVTAATTDYRNKTGTTAVKNKAAPAVLVHNTPSAAPYRVTRPVIQPQRTTLPQKFAKQPRSRPPQNHVSRLPLMPIVNEFYDTDSWDLNLLPNGKSFRLVNLANTHKDYLRVNNAFRKTTQKHLQVVKIERVENPFLMGCYLLKKEEMRKRYGTVEEMMNFHGTRMCNVAKICENGFDWKLHGDSVGHRFGQGVSFSPISFYASHYSDRIDGEKIMFYVRVLKSHMVTGTKNSILPPKLHDHDSTWYDTTCKENGHVVVKFSDNEFYPEFIIHYTGPITKPTPKRNINYQNDEHW